MFDFIGHGLILADIYVNGTLTYTSANIVDGSFSVNRYATTTIAPEMGHVSAGEMQFTLDTTTINVNIQAGDIVKAKLYLESDRTVFTETGDFIVSSVIATQHLIQVNALDKMITLDGVADLSNVTYPITANDFINQVFATDLGLTVDISNSIYKTVELKEPTLSEGTTYRQVLSKVCECMGANAYFTDKLYIKWYEDISCTFTDEEYFDLDLTDKGFTFNVEATKDYTASSVELSGTEITLRIVANPFLEQATDTELTAIANQIKTNIGNGEVYGISMKALQVPELKPMDIITIGSKKVPVTEVTFGINENTKVEGKIDGSSDYNNGLPRLVKAETERAVTNLEIGGRNLVIGTLNPKSTPQADRPHIQTGVTMVNGTASTTTHGIKATTVSGGTRPYIMLGSSNAEVRSLQGLEAGETYTLSFDAKWKLLSGDISGQTTYYVNVTLYDDKSGASAVDVRKRISPIKYADRGTEMSTRAEFTFTIPENATWFYIYIGGSLTTASAYGEGDYIEAMNLKLEKGTKATDWTPAPEDYESQIAEVITLVEDAEGKAMLHYGTCTTAVGTKAKTVALDGFTLYEGATVTVKFANGNSHSSPTLNVGGTGAKPIMVNDTTTTTGKLNLPANTNVTFVYDGTNWQYISSDNLLNEMDWTPSGGLVIRAENGSNSRVNITNNSVDIYDSGGNLGSSTTADGMDIYKGGTNVAHIGEYARIGEELKCHVEIEESKFAIIGDDASELAFIGKIGADSMGWYKDLTTDTDFTTRIELEENQLPNLTRGVSVGFDYPSQYVISTLYCRVTTTDTEVSQTGDNGEVLKLKYHESTGSEKSYIDISLTNTAGVTYGGYATYFYRGSIGTYTFGRNLISDYGGNFVIGENNMDIRNGGYKFVIGGGYFQNSGKLVRDDIFRVYGTGDIGLHEYDFSSNVRKITDLGITDVFDRTVAPDYNLIKVKELLVAYAELFGEQNTNNTLMNKNNSFGAEGTQKAQGWGIISTAQGNLDLNGITDFGIYYCNSSTTAGNVQNRPPVSANIFKLEVKGLVPNANREFVYIEQTYTSIVAQVITVYKRYTTDGGTTWRDWRECTFLPESVSATEDFDDLIVSGTYSYNSGTANKPTGTTTGGALIVARYNATYIKQIAFPNGTTPRMCIRYMNNGTWGNWYEAALTQMS